MTEISLLSISSDYLVSSFFHFLNFMDLVFIDFKKSNLINKFKQSFI